MRRSAGLVLAVAVLALSALACGTGSTRDDDWPATAVVASLTADAAQARAETVVAAPPPTDRPEPTATPLPTATAGPLDLTAAELRRQWETLTDVQIEAYEASLIGQRVRWSCPVMEVYSGGRVALDCETGDEFTNCMARFRVSDAEALKYNKGDMVTFEGRIAGIETFLLFGVRFDSVTVISID